MFFLAGSSQGSHAWNGCGFLAGMPVPGVNGEIPGQPQSVVHQLLPIFASCCPDTVQTEIRCPITLCSVIDLA